MSKYFVITNNGEVTYGGYETPSPAKMMFTLNGCKWLTAYTGGQPLWIVPVVVWPQWPLMIFQSPAWYDHGEHIAMGLSYRIFTETHYIGGLEELKPPYVDHKMFAYNLNQKGWLSKKSGLKQWVPIPTQEVPPNLRALLLLQPTTSGT